jgi:hypothetical protein
VVEGRRVAVSGSEMIDYIVVFTKGSGDLRL